MIAVLVLAQCLLAFLLFSGTDPETIAVEQWKLEVAASSVKEIIARLHRLADDGVKGLPLLAETLTDSRETVVNTARVELLRLIDRWNTLDEADASNNRAVLAHQLARHCQKFSPIGREAAASLATQILLHPVAGRGSQGAQLVVDCEVVLRAHAAAPAQPAAETAGRTTQDPIESAIQSPVQAKNVKSMAEAVAQIPPMPPAKFEAADGPQIRGVDPAADSSFANRPRTLPLPPVNAGAADPLAKPYKFRPPAAPIGKLPADGTGTPNGLTSLPLIEVMRLLHDEDPEAAQGAVDELERRKLSETERKIAARLTDPDPVVRRDLARRLPRIRHVDPTEWLLWLAEDSDVQVREEAISILATSRDPQVRETVRRLLESESSPRILQRIKPDRLR